MTDLNLTKLDEREREAEAMGLPSIYLSLQQLRPLLDLVKEQHETLGKVAEEVHSETEDGPCLGEHWGERDECRNPLCKCLVAALAAYERAEGR